MKICIECNSQKDESEFNKHKVTKDGLCSYCRACQSAKKKLYALNNQDKFIARRKAYYEANKEREKARVKAHAIRTGRKQVISPELSRARHLKRLYNITPDQYNELLASQGSVCALCLKESKDKPLYVDHNHITGKNRALLCHKCNTSLGLVSEDINLLQRMIEYLIKHAA